MGTYRVRAGLLTLLWSVQIHMREDAMPQTVLAIATARLAREMLRRDDCYEGLCPDPP